MLHFNSSEKGQAALEAAVIFVILMVVGWVLMPWAGRLLTGGHNGILP